MCVWIENRKPRKTPRRSFCVHENEGLLNGHSFQFHHAEAEEQMFARNWVVRETMSFRKRVWGDSQGEGRERGAAMLGRLARPSHQEWLRDTVSFAFQKAALLGLLGLRKEQPALTRCITEWNKYMYPHTQSTKRNIIKPITRQVWYEQILSTLIIQENTSRMSFQKTIL